MKIIRAIALLAILAIAYCQTDPPVDDHGCWPCPAGRQHWYDIGMIEPSDGDRCQCLISDETTSPAPTTTEVPHVFNMTQLCPGRKQVGRGGQCTLSGELYCIIGQACAPSGQESRPYTCQVPSKIGQDCSATNFCVNSPFYPGAKLECIKGKCAFINKRNGDSCVAAEECASGRCEKGACAENWVDGACSKDTDCQPSLTCDTTAGKCMDSANLNEPCGILKEGGSAKRCKSGFTCVGNTTLTTGFCKPSVKEGESCSADVGPVYRGPTCSDISQRCINGKCTVYQGAAEGEKCNDATPCKSSLTCHQGTCQTPSNVQCDMRNNTNCGSNQYCNCGSDPMGNGVCVINDADPRSSAVCAEQEAALKSCISQNCGDRQVFYPYDGKTCVATQCTDTINKVLCCQKSLMGNAFIAPSGMPSNACGGSSFPTSAPSTTAAPVGTDPLTPVPTQRSGAARETFSALVIIALIIFASL